MTLRLAEQNGARCAGPVLMAGLVLGFGVVRLATGALDQTSRFSLELLSLLLVQLVGPMLVALLALALLLPSWMERAQRLGNRAWRQSVPAAALVGALLLLFFLLAALCGGVLASPRADLVGEIRELLAGLLPLDVYRAVVRSGAFQAALCGWSQWRTMVRTQRGVDPRMLVSDQLVEGLMVLLSLKLIWITVIDPLDLSTSAP